MFLHQVAKPSPMRASIHHQPYDIWNKKSKNLVAYVANRSMEEHIAFAKQNHGGECSLQQQQQ